VVKKTVIHGCVGAQIPDLWSDVLETVKCGWVFVVVSQWFGVSLLSVLMGQIRYC